MAGDITAYEAALSHITLFVHLLTSSVFFIAGAMTIQSFCQSSFTSLATRGIASVLHCYNTITAWELLFLRPFPAALGAI